MGGGASSKLRRAARKIVQTCGSFSRGQSPVPMSPGQPRISATPGEAAYATQPLSSTSTPKNLCAICLDPLSYGTGPSPAQAVFTAQCSHAFHFACISCNVRHGSVTCPICRAHWTQLPRNLNPSCSLFCNKTDPILQILDDSIATFRVHRRSILRSARYNDDDPIEPNSTPTHHRLHFNIIPVTFTPPSCHPCSNQSLQVTHLNSCHSYGLLSLNHLRTSSSLLAASPGGQHFAPTGKTPSLCTSSSRAYLSVTLARQPAIDLVLVASPNGPHFRLIKQCMALVVFSLRPIDRLAIVTYSSAAARVFPLKRMTSYGKRTALQVIDRIFYMGQADPIEGLKKGVKILGDCTHKNPRSSILHLSDSPTRSYHRIDIGKFHSNPSVSSILRVGLMNALGQGKYWRAQGMKERRVDGTEALVSIAGRNSSVESWDYHDPYRARRWAKHLHGYRI
ncbi:hypothetical protein Acr_15g0019310 [Actinidia rufa]|uniref:RING-type domain-containing protein n=1 Tax=Actinidia rufa TaxID=165716 RepID=A0A7J0FXA8_9ERIC|nr:hypothetical protein Acr_15g0019310 [Actinidia rufa]